MSQDNRYRKIDNNNDSGEHNANITHGRSAQEKIRKSSVTRTASSEASEGNSDSEIDKPKCFSISSILSKRETKDVLPEFAGSSSHNGVLTANSSKDMNFTLELSENLLVECRKLQSSNDDKNEQIKSLKQVNESLNGKIKEIYNQKKYFMKELDSVKDLNWDLESKLANLCMECKQLKELRRKTEKSWNDEKESLRNLKTDIEVLTLTKNGMENDLHSQKLYYEREINELKGRIVDLNNENDKLTISASDLTSEINSLRSDKAEKIEIRKQLNNAKKSIHSLKSKLQKKYCQQKGFSDNTVAIDSESECASSEEDIFDIVADIDHIIEAQPSVENLSEDLVKEYLEKNNLTLLSNDSYKNLLQSTKCTYEPKDDGLMTKEVAENLNIFALPNDDNYNKKEFSLESQIKNLEASGRKVLPQEEFTNLKQFVSKPSYSYLKEKLQASKKIPIDQNTFSLLEEPTIDFLLPLASKIDCLVIPTKDYNKIYETAKDPSVEQVKEYLAANNNLESSISEWLEEKNDCKLVSNNVYSSLVDQVKTPSIQHLSIKAKEYNQVLIDSKKLEALENPTIEVLKKKISASDFLILKKEDYERPSLGYLVEHAKNTDHHMLSETAYQDLVKYKETPDIEFMKEKSSKLGHTIVSNEMYADLQSKYSEAENRCSDLENKYSEAESKYSDLENKYSEAESKYSDLENKYSDLENTHSEVQKQLEHPSLLYLVEHAKNTDHHMLSETAYQDLVKYKETPDIEFMKEKSSKLGHTIVSNEMYADLQSKYSEAENRCSDLENKYSETKSKYSDLENKYSDLENKYSDLENKYSDLENKCSEAENKYSEVQKQLEHPSLLYLVEHAKNTDHHMLSETAYQDLVKYKETPDIEFMKEKSSKLGHTIVSNEMYADLQSKYSEAENRCSDLENKYSETKSKYSDLENKYSDLENKYSDLENKCSEAENKCSEVQKQLEHPSLLYLVEHAKNTDHHMLSETAYQDLVKYKETPDIEFMKEKSSKLGHTIVSNEMYADLQSKYSEAENRCSDLENKYSETKSKYSDLENKYSDLENKYSDLENKCFEAENKCSEVQKQLEHPSLLYLVEHAKNTDHHMLSETAYQDLVKYKETPDIEFMKEKSSKLGHTIVSNEMYADLQSKYSEAENRCSDLENKYSETKSKYSDLENKYSDLENKYSDLENKCSEAENKCSEVQKQLEHPSLLYLVEHAKNTDHHMLSETAYQDLVKYKETPDIEFMKEKSSKLGHTIVSNEMYADLQSKYSEAENRCSDLENKYSEAESKYSDLENKYSEAESKYSDLENKYSDLENTHSEVQKQLEHPSLLYLVEHAKNTDHHMLSETAYQDLVKYKETPDIEFMKEKSSKLGHTIVSNEMYADLQSKYSEAENRCSDLENKYSETKSKYSDLENKYSDLENTHSEVQKQLEHPSLLYLVEHAKNTDHHMLSETAYQDLVKYKETPDIEFMKEKSSKLGYTIVSNEMYADLQSKYSEAENRCSDLENKYSETKSKYSDLENKYSDLENTHSEVQKQLEHPSLLYLVEHAKNTDHHMLSETAYQDLVKYKETPDIEFMKEKSSKLGHTIVSNEMYADLQSKYSEAENRCSDLENKYSETKSKYSDLENKYSDLENKYSDLENKCFEAENKCSEVQKQLEHPSLLYLVEHAKNTDHHMLSETAYQDLVKYKETPDIEFMKEKSSKLGHTIVSNEMYADLQSKYSEAENRCSDLENKYSETKSKYSDLENKYSDLENKYSDLENKCSEAENKCSEVQKQLEHPSLLYLVEHAKNTDHHMLSETAYQDLVKYKETPDIEFMKEKSSKLGHTIVSNEMYADLQSKYSEAENRCSDLENKYSETKSKYSDLENKYSDLENKYSDLENKCSEAENKCSEVQKQLEHPSLLYLVEHAKNTDHHMLSETAYQDLVKYKETPDIEFMKEKSSKLGHTIVSNEMYADLQSKYSEAENRCSDLENKYSEAESKYSDLENKYSEAESKYSDLENKYSDLENTHSEVQKQLEHPSLLYLVEHAKNTDHHMLSETAYQDLVKYKETPDIEFMKEKSSKLGHTIVSNEMYADLQSKYSEAENRCSDLENKYSETKSKYSDLENKYSDLENTHSEVQKQLEHPSLLYLVEHAKNTDHHMLSETAYQDLVKYKETPDIEFMKEKSSKLGHTIVSNEMYADLQSKYSEAENRCSDLENKYSETKSKYSDLENKYSDLENKYSDLENKCSEAENKCSEVQKQLEHPSLLYLVEHAKNTDHHMLSETAYQDLVKYKETPDIEFMKEKSSKLGHTIVSNEMYADLQSKYSEAENRCSDLENKYSETKSKYSDLENKYSDLENTHSEVQKQLEHPSLLYLVEHAKNTDHHMLSETAYQDLVKYKETPDIEFMKEKSSKLGHTIVSNEMYADLQSKYSEAENRCSDLENKYSEAESKYSDLENKYSEAESKYSDLENKYSDLENTHSEVQKQLEHPSLLYLVEHAKNTDHHMLSETAYQDLVKYKETPDIEFMKEKSSKLGHTIVSNEMYADLQSKYSEAENRCSDLQSKYSDVEEQLEHPSLAYLIEHVEELQKKIIPASDLNTLMDPSLEYLTSKLHSLHYDVIPHNSYIELKKMIEDPDVKFLESKLNGYSIIEAGVYNELFINSTSPTLEFIKEKADDKGYMLIEAQKYLDLNRIATNPSKEEIIDICKQSGCFALEFEEYEKLKNSVQKPSKKFIEEKAILFDLVLVDRLEYQTMKDKLSNKDSLIASVEEFGFVAIPAPRLASLEKSSLQSSTLSDIEAKLQTFGYVTITKENLANLEKQTVESVSKDDVLNLCSKFSLVPLCDEEYDEMKKEKALNLNELSDSSIDILKEKCENHGLILINKSIYEEKQEALENPAYEFILEKALALGYELISKVELARMKQEINSPSIDHMQQKAAYNNMVLLKSEETEALCDKIEHPSLTYLTEKAAGMNKILIDQVTNNECSYSNRKELEEYCHRLNLILIGEDEYTALKDLLEDSNVDDSKKSSSNNDLSLNITRSNSTTTSSMFTDALDDNIEEFNDIKFERNEDITDIISKSSTVKEIVQLAPAYETIKSSAEELGYKLVPIESSGMNPVSMDTPLFSGDNDGTNIVSSVDFNYLSKRVKKYGMNLISDESFEEYRVLKDKVATINGSIEGADNFVIVSQTLTTETQNIPKEHKPEEDITCNGVDKEGIINSARELNLVVLNEREYTELLSRSEKHLVSKADIIREAANFDLVPVQKQKLEEIKYELAHPTSAEGQPKKPSGDRNLILTSRDKTLFPRDENLISQSDVVYDDDISDSFADETQEIETDVDVIKTQARKYGMLCIPESAFVVTSFSNTPDTDNIVALPTPYYHNLLSSENKKLNFVNNEELQAENKRRGFQMVLPTKKDSETQSAPSKREGHSYKSSNKMSITSSKNDIRKGLAEAAATTAYGDSEGYPQVQQSHHYSHHKHHKRHQSLTNSNSTSKTAHSSKNTLASKRDGMASSMPHAGSSDRAVSLQTLASLNEPSIIPALTQTVIGEYLFKYYPRLGPFGFESRHERFFWIHPYTLTLYWSASNPILENPANTKTKGVAILGVESVTDPNPYPTGLYHKSIVVTTETRTIKLTCPTRQRHNIWYNSLRYLIQRNMQGISLEDIADDPTDNMYSGKIFPLPGESTKSSSKRLSASRRSVSARSLRNRVPKSRSFGNLK